MDVLDHCRGVAESGEKFPSEHGGDLPDHASVVTLDFLVRSQRGSSKLSGASLTREQPTSRESVTLSQEASRSRRAPSPRSDDAGIGTPLKFVDPSKGAEAPCPALSQTRLPHAPKPGRPDALQAPFLVPEPSQRCSGVLRTVSSPRGEGRRSPPLRSGCLQDQTLQDVPPVTTSRRRRWPESPGPEGRTAHLGEVERVPTTRLSAAAADLRQADDPALPSRHR